MTVKAELIYTVCCRHKPHFSNLPQSHGTQASKGKMRESGLIKWEIWLVLFYTWKIRFHAVTAGFNFVASRSVEFEWYSDTWARAGTSTYSHIPDERSLVTEVNIFTDHLLSMASWPHETYAMAIAFPSFIRILLREIVVFFKLGINLIWMRSVTS